MMLQWASGPEVRIGWQSSDRDDYGQEHVGDLLNGLPWPDGTFDAVVANHGLSAIAYPNLLAALRELRRVLKPGGWLRIIDRDLHLALRAYTDDDRSWFPILDDIEEDIEGAMCAYLTWYGQHPTVLTRSVLTRWCLRAGFARAEPVGFHTTLAPFTHIMDLDSRESESLVVEAQR